MTRLFWVEDQSHWIDKFTPILRETDFDGAEDSCVRNQLDVFKFAEAARQRIAQTALEERPDIAILDAHMNGSDEAGFTVSRALLAKWPDLPIIFLSEHSGTDIEEQAITRADAQDFIAKHQRNVEAVLCWRIKAVLKKTRLDRSAPETQLISGSLRIDLDNWDVFWRGTKLMNPHNPKRPLAPTPRKILRCLVESSPRPLSTEQIADRLDADLERFSYANYRQHIKTLRMAFDAAESTPGAFSSLCQSGRGIVTFGDAHAYCWKSDQ